MHESIMKTAEQIDEALRKGEEFVKRSPYSVFGDDNVSSFKMFKKVMAKAKEGLSSSEIENFIEELYEDDEDEYFDALSMLDWLMNKNYEDYY